MSVKLLVTVSFSKTSIRMALECAISLRYMVIARHQIVRIDVLNGEKWYGLRMITTVTRRMVDVMGWKE